MSGEKLSLVGHLGELRQRLIYCIIAAFLGTVVAFFFYDPWILNLLRGPLDSLSGRVENPFFINNPLLRFLKSSSTDLSKLKLNLHYISLMEPFMVKLKFSLFGGIILSFPFIFYQIWIFVSAGLTKKERGAVRVLLPASFLLFLCGLLIAYFIMLPVVLYFMIMVSGSSLEPTLIISKYASVVIMCCLSFGVIFEIPLVILFLTKLGIVSPKFLIEKRKYIIVLIFILAAILTPPDIISQIMMALPMIVLYEISILVSKIVWGRRQKMFEDSDIDNDD